MPLDDNKDYPGREDVNIPTPAAEPEPEKPVGFGYLGLEPELLQAVDDLGFTQPTPIQADAIPPAMEGRDVLGAAMTGSGKTAAFLLPILQQLLARRRGVTRGLVLTPTRELAAQVEQHLQDLGKYTDLTAAVIHGGVAFEPQERAIRRGFDMIIATPGRLLDHLRRPYGHLDEVEFLVLDEADRMLDMGFIPDVRRILGKMPARRQTMLFSATMPGPIASLSRELLREPATINIERKAAPATGITQAAYFVRHAYKPALLLHLLRHGGIDNALAFTRTKDRADRLASYLSNHGVKVTAIHGDRSQVQRTRALEAFKKGKFRVLVATDVAARGIDVEGLSHVINVDVPAQPEDYIHRIGRTGRQQATGDAMTFVAARELADLHAIERAIRSKLPRIQVEDFDYDKGRSKLDDPPAPKAVAKPPVPVSAAEPVAPKPRPSTPKTAASPPTPQPSAPLAAETPAPSLASGNFDNEVPAEAREAEIAPVEPATDDRTEVLYRFAKRCAWRRGDKVPLRPAAPQPAAPQPASPPPAPKPATLRSAAPQAAPPQAAPPAPAAARPVSPKPSAPQPAPAKAESSEPTPPRPAAPRPAAPQAVPPQPSAPQAASPGPSAKAQRRPRPERSEILERYRSMRRRQRG